MYEFRMKYDNGVSDLLEMMDTEDRVLCQVDRGPTA